MTPLTELTALMRDYAERHGIKDVFLVLEMDSTGKACTFASYNVLFQFDSETDFLNKIKG